MATSIIPFESSSHFQSIQLTVNWGSSANYAIDIDNLQNFYGYIYRVQFNAAYTAGTKPSGVEAGLLIGFSNNNYGMQMMLDYKTAKVYTRNKPYGGAWGAWTALQSTP